jgi:hypothetical protein
MSQVSELCKRLAADAMELQRLRGAAGGPGGAGSGGSGAGASDGTVAAARGLTSFVSSLLWGAPSK